MQTFLEKMYKNIFWLHLTLQKVFRQILITVTRDKINDASFRQKLDPISKNILRRQNLLELVFEDISTFDAENLIVRSFLRELDLKKKQSDSDFIKSLPSQPGKEFEIKKRLDRLRQGGKNFRGKNNNSAGNNNNNNNFDGGNKTCLVLVVNHLVYLLLKIF